MSFFSASFLYESFLSESFLSGSFLSESFLSESFLSESFLSESFLSESFLSFETAPVKGRSHIVSVYTYVIIRQDANKVDNELRFVGLKVKQRACTGIRRYK
jgi:hypothetical protein